MQAIELVSAGQAPNADATKALAQYCLEHGVILVTAGSYGNVVRVLMPLVITDAQMDESLDVMETGLALLSGAETPSIPEHAVVS
jgi:4-aminobutyrate aminotransferase/(S)-3-amino-2-methylpropionate transaminase